ncbi:MAG: SDR family NAD(P)-dependent oxidoreductase [Gammaproteobacteria bacterium]|nr:SDR family NAD(P)-dependent oxidoreductase [Gammaproteobacteria bacterium]
MDLDLTGRRALVTGGSRGIGRAIVEVLAEEGCRVSFCARDAERVGTTGAELRAAGLHVHGHVADVTNDAALESWMTASAADLGGIDILVANAGALANTADLSAWRQGFETDVLGTVATVEHAIPHLRESDDGSIVVISSAAALEIYAGERPYNAIKATLTAYAGGLAQRLAPDGIRANVVSPGAVMFEGSVWERARVERPEAYADMVARTVIGRLGNPREIAQAVAYVASPVAGFVTGTNFVIDGGLTKRIHY